jgi:DNA-binding CsgD family transcriptional regulator
VELPEPLDRYRISLWTAEKEFRRLGRNSIDGREPHDIAMHSLTSPAWSDHRVRLDVIDAYRKERGRRARTGEPLRRKFQQIPSDLATRDPPHHPDDYLDGWDLSPGQLRMVRLLVDGLTKTQTARWLGVSQAAVTDAVRRIREKNEHKRNQHLDNGDTLDT